MYSNNQKSGGIALLETAMILVPMLIFIAGVVGIIDFIRVGRIISRTQDAQIRSLSGRPYRFDRGVIVFNRQSVDQDLKKIVNETYALLGQQICGQDPGGCTHGLSVRGAVQEIQINAHTGAISSVGLATGKPEWSAGNLSNAAGNFDEAFAGFRTTVASLGMPSGVYGTAFLPVTVLILLDADYLYPSNSLTQRAFDLFSGGKAKHQAMQVVVARGDVE